MAYAAPGYASVTNKSYDYSAVGLNTFAPRSASAPLTPNEFKLIPGKSVKREHMGVNAALKYL